MAFLKAIYYNPKFSKAYYKLAQIYSTEGEFYNVEKATILFNKYLDLEPNAKNKTKILRWLSNHNDQEEILKSNTDVETDKNAKIKSWLIEQAESLGNQ